jgi:hypothetical protein
VLQVVPELPEGHDRVAWRSVAAGERRRRQPQYQPPLAHRIGEQRVRWVNLDALRHPCRPNIKCRKYRACIIGCYVSRSHMTRNDCGKFSGRKVTNKEDRRISPTKGSARYLTNRNNHPRLSVADDSGSLVSRMRNEDER